MASLAGAPLMIGKSIAHYRILRRIGSGGMGVVYEAEDPKLGRHVALKVLPPALVSDPERKRRFTLEARAAAQLEHPHIGVVHEIGETDGVTYIVMELIRGETLSEILDRQCPSLSQALGLATEIAEGLARAHEKGIVHRDLKPGNIMVTEDGHAKIIDFGLAKLREAPESGISDSETATAMTESGVVLGTAEYMSPEQARGQTVDHRSDVFGFGVVLYEMVTGKHPFKSTSRLDTLHAIVNSTAPPLELPGSEEVAGDLQRLLDKCMAKDPADRYQGTRDVVVDLRAARRRLESGLVTPTALAPGRSLLRRFWMMGTALVLLTVAVTVAVRLGIQTSHARWARNVALPEVVRLAKEERLQAAFRLARQAALYLPDDPQLQRQIRDITTVTSINSTPPGAQVFFADYLDPSADWEMAGTTPIGQTRVPYGLLRWKVVKDGFEESVTPATSGARSLEFPLLAKGTSPPGMVAIPAGHQDSGDGVDHELPDFWLDRYEVTNADFKRFVDAGGYRKREYWDQPFVKDGRTLSWEEAMALFRDQTGRPGPATWTLGSFPEGEDDQPVGGVSWFEAAAFAKFAGKSLPTVHHWRYVALKTQINLYSFVTRLSNFHSDGPKPVGQSRALGPYGTYDMAGNVKEWTWTAYKDGTRVLAGGAWGDPEVMFEQPEPASPFSRYPTFGFRCARYTRAPSPDVLAPFVDVDSESTVGRPVGDEVFRVYKSLYNYERRDLRAAVENVEETPYWRNETVSYDAAYGDERVLAHLFLPKKATPPYQMVIYFPEGWAEFLKSSRDLDVRWVGFIVQSGRAVLVPVFKGTFERQPSVQGSIPFRELMIDWAKDLGRSIDYLETRKDIDRQRIAFYGFSLGTYVGPVAAVVEPRIKTLILLNGGLFGGVAPQADVVNFAPRARIPVLMIHGVNDYVIGKRSQQLFELFGTPPEHKRLALVEGGHIPARREEVIREVLDWLDRYLGPV